MSTTTALNPAAEALQAGMEQAMTAQAYQDLFAQVVAQGRTTGPEQNDELKEYTKLNLARTSRVNKTVKLLPELVEVLQNLPPMNWLVITEAWCGDSSQCTPVLAMLAGAAPKVKLGILLRDNHLELMDHFLTNGTRGIPKLVAFDKHGKELFTWGPRPAAAQGLVAANKALPPEEQLPKEEIYAKVHAWYAADKGHAIQQEMLALLRKL